MHGGSRARFSEPVELERCNRRMRTSLLILLASFVLVPSASAAGPWLGVSSTMGGWNAVASAHTTTIRHGHGSVTLNGDWGFPFVTLHEDVGGLSADGRTLVLAQGNVAHPGGDLAKKSAFAVLGTKPLHVRTVFTVKGDFGFDALSPHGSTLYLIEHVPGKNLFRYRVRAYDLSAGRLLPEAVADKRQQSWNMEGYPVSRASTANGGWVYTLYSNGNNYPFVHALDAVHRTAVCVGIPWKWTTAADQNAIARATLKIVGGKLSVGSRFVLDRATFRVTRAGNGP